MLARRGPAGQMRQLGRQDRRLHAIEPAVDALDMMLVFDEPAVTREHCDVLGQCVVIGDNGAGVAYRPQIVQPSTDFHSLKPL